MFNEPSFRFYILLEHLITFEYIVDKYKLDIKTEIDSLTDSKTQVYYIRRTDFPKLDELCKKYDIAIVDDYAPYTREQFNLHNFPIWVRITIIILISIFISILIF